MNKKGQGGGELGLTNASADVKTSATAAQRSMHERISSMAAARIRVRWGKDKTREGEDS